MYEIEMSLVEQVPVISSTCVVHVHTSGLEDYWFLGELNSLQLRKQTKEEDKNIFKNHFKKLL